MNKITAKFLPNENVKGKSKNSLLGSPIANIKDSKQMLHYGKEAMK